MSEISSPTSSAIPKPRTPASTAKRSSIWGANSYGSVCVTPHNSCGCRRPPADSPRSKCSRFCAASSPQDSIKQTGTHTPRPHDAEPKSSHRTPTKASRPHSGCREKIRIEGHVEVPQRDRNGLGREAMPINGRFNRPSTLRWVCHALANDCDAQYADLGEFDLPWRKRANAPPSTAVSESSALVLFVLASCHSLDLRSLQFAPLIHPARPSRVHPVTCRLLPLREESSRHGSCSLLQDAVADTAITGGVRCAIPSL